MKLQWSEFEPVTPEGATGYWVKHEVAVITCEVCRSLVTEDDAAAHADWHRQMERP